MSSDGLPQARQHELEVAQEIQQTSTEEQGMTMMMMMMMVVMAGAAVIVYIFYIYTHVFSVSMWEEFPFSLFSFGLKPPSIVELCKEMQSQVCDKGVDPCTDHALQQ